LPPGKAGDEPAPNRIGNNSDDDGEGPGRWLGDQGGGCVWGHEDINLERNQFGRKSGEPLVLPLGISVFNHDVAALDVTEVTQSLTEGLVQVGGSQVGVQVAYSRDLGRLLGLGRNATGLSPPRRRVMVRASLGPIISTPGLRTYFRGAFGLESPPSRLVLEAERPR
jgi:hypothetical protein